MSQTSLLPLLFPHIPSFLARIPQNVLNLITCFYRLTIILLTYIFAPVITFSSILYAVALTTPFNLLKWLLEALFPLYVFCGVACITGGLLGLCGRFLCSIIVKSLSAERLQKGKKYHQGTLKTSEVDPDVRSAKRRKVERDPRLEVKFELDGDSNWYEVLQNCTTSQTDTPSQIPRRLLLYVQ